MKLKQKKLMGESKDKQWVQYTTMKGGYRNLLGSAVVVVAVPLKSQVPPPLRIF